MCVELMNEMLQQGYKVDILYIQLADGWYNAVLSEWGKGNGIESK